MIVADCRKCESDLEVSESSLFDKGTWWKGDCQPKLNILHQSPYIYILYLQLIWFSARTKNFHFDHGVNSERMHMQRDVQTY
jgi:hypothetical protein